MHRRFLLACLLAAVTPAAASGAEPPEKVTITADSISHDAEGDTYEAKGGVRVKSDGLVLMSDSMSVSDDGDRGVATGNVRLEKGEDLLTGDRLEIDLENETGSVTNGRLNMGKGLRAQGPLIRKTGENTYSVMKGTFTTCEGERPSWKFYSSDLNVKPEYATGTNVLFYLSDVPVLYLPYIAYPVVRERQSGLLLPRFGTSTRKGFYLELPLYLAISPSQEATITADIQTKRAEGGEAEYRYLGRNGSDGTLHTHLMYDNEAGRVRGSFRGEQRQVFSPTLYGASSFTMVTDRNFLREFADNAEDYTRRFADSTFFLTRNSGSLSMTARAAYVQDLVPRTLVQVPPIGDVDLGGNWIALPKDDVLQELPSLGLQILPVPVAERILFSVKSDATNFYRESGNRGQRITATPQIAWYAPAVSPVSANAWGGYGAALYHEEGTGTTVAGGVEGGASLSLPLSRIYDLEKGKVRHLLIPEVSYRYRQARRGQDVPFFDFADRSPEENIVEFSLSSLLTSRSTVEGESAYNDFLRLSATQGVILSGAERDLLVLKDEKGTLGDLRAAAEIRPAQDLSVLLDASYEHGRGIFSTAGAGVAYRHERDEFSLRYRSLRPGELRLAGVPHIVLWGPHGDVVIPDPSTLLQDTSYVEAHLSYRIGSPWTVGWLARYSPERGDFLESQYSIEYRSQCWGVMLRFVDRADVPQRQGTRDFQVRFVIGGL